VEGESGLDFSLTRQQQVSSAWFQFRFRFQFRFYNSGSASMSSLNPCQCIVYLCVFRVRVCVSESVCASALVAGVYVVCRCIRCVFNVFDES